MIQKLILFLSLLVSSSVGLSQTFTGTVLDSETQQPVYQAQIYFIDLKTGTITDEKGIFTIEHYRQKNIHLQITYLGYEPLDFFLNLEEASEKIFYLNPGHLELDEIVIAVPGGKLQGDNILPVEHKNLTQIYETSSLTLSEALSNIPGVDQNTTGPGIGKPVIRGLSGSRIVTYSQGIRIENQQWGEEHGLGIGKLGIESVEVIKGPSSLLYGSDALGGVLYFIDERYARHDAVESFISSEFFTNTLGFINKAGIKFHKGSSKLNLFGSYGTHADYIAPGVQRVMNTRFNEKNIKASYGFNTKNWIANLRYSFLSNRFGITEDAKYSSLKQRSFELPFQNIKNQIFSIENIVFAGESRLKLNLGFTNNYRKEFEEDEIEHALGLILKTFTYNLTWHLPSHEKSFGFILGTQGMIQSNKNNGEEILIPDAKINDVGGFAIVNFDIGEFRLQGGLRIDRRKIDTDQIQTEESNFPALQTTFTGHTFSGGAIFTSGRSTIRTNLSSGFRAPTTTELLSNGIHEGTNRFERGNVSLINERALQADLTYDYKTEHLNISLSPFYNSIRDYIYLSPTSEIINNAPVFDYLQTDASLYGTEIGIHYHPHQIHWLHIESNLSSVFAQDENDNSLPLIPQTNLSSSMSAEFSSKGKFQFKRIYLQHIHKFEQNNISYFETMSSAYNLFNLGVALEITKSNFPIELNMGVNNLFNTRYIDHLSRFKNLSISNPGINFHLGIRLKMTSELK